MNCFEARQEFPALWRKTATAERPSRFAQASREVSRQNRWLSMAAAAAIFVFATSAAYLSTRTPRESFGDELSVPESSMTSETTGDPLAPEMPVTESDLAS